MWSTGHSALRPVTVAIASLSQKLSALKDVFNDALYRGSLYLLANNVAAAAIGFVFWTLAAHKYAASTVGVFSGVTSGVSFLAAIASLGLPITMTRHIAGAKDPRQLVFMAVVVIATVGTILCFFTVLFLGPHLPAALHIQQRGKMALLVTVLVVFTAAGTTLDAGLVAIRSSRVVLVKNLAGSLARLGAMLLLVTFRSSGLIISFLLGLVLATLLSGAALGRRIRVKDVKFNPFHLPWRYLSTTSGNYLATVIGILPLSLVPIEVLAARGATETARFSVAFLIAGFLNFIPSTTGQVLFAEIARGGVPLGKQLRKAFRAVYGFMLPPLVLLLAGAPLILRLFGQAYASDATGCLRVLALSALPAGGTYLICSVLIARDRIAIYTFMQIANAVLILGGVGLLLPHGLTAAASGLAIAQVLTLVLCLLALPTGKVGRHHPGVYAGPAEQVPQRLPDDEERLADTYAFGSQIPEPLATWPMPIMPAPSSYQHEGRTRYLVGQTAQCSLWFPPIELPVGFGQTRSGNQLPVLTMITGYSRWLSAVLIPSTRAEDFFAGWWELIAELGAVPHILTSYSEDGLGWYMAGQADLADECNAFCHSLGTEVVLGSTGNATPTGLIEQAQAHLEDSFLDGRTFTSPEDFNVQLRHWVSRENMRDRQPPSYSPAASIAADREAMIPLPPIPPATGWRLSIPVNDRPLIYFDSNYYSVPASATGRTVEIVANLRKIEVLCGRRIVAQHDRAWTRGRVIRDPADGPAMR